MVVIRVGMIAVVDPRFDKAVSSEVSTKEEASESDFEIYHSSLQIRNLPRSPETSNPSYTKVSFGEKAEAILHSAASTVAELLQVDQGIVESS